MTHDLSYHGPVVILDLDDTLYPEYQYVLSGYKAIADTLQRRDGIDSRESFAVMRNAFDAGLNPFDKLAETYHDISHPEKFIPLCVNIYRYHTPALTLPDDSEEFLKQLQNAGIRMALVTDGRAVTQWNKIRALGVCEFFNPQDIWISEERGIGKESVEPWRAIAGHYPEAARFYTIGDNPAKDFLYPNMLGFTTICLRDSGHNIHPQGPMPSDIHKPAIMVDTLTDSLSVILAK